MLGGYTGKILFVDLTAGTIKEEAPSESVYRDFIGGTGLGVRILYERMKPKADPLGKNGLSMKKIIPLKSSFQVV